MGEGYPERCITLPTVTPDATLKDIGEAMLNCPGEVVRSNDLARKIMDENSIGSKEIKAIVEGNYSGRVFTGDAGLLQECSRN